MSAKHTPGPWRVVPYDCGDKDEWPGTPSVQAAPEMDCAIVHWAGFKQRYWESARGRAEMEANARLIASAPELLEAMDPQGLEFAADCLERLERAPRVVERLRNMAANQRAAIARATGEQG